MNDLNNKSPLSSEESLILREKFIVEFSKERGWNPDELTSVQMLEIVSCREYKNPGLILG